MISTLLFTISIPNLMKATSEDVQGLNNTFDFLHPNKAFDPKFYRLKNFAASATIRSISAYFLSIYNNSNLGYSVISSTDPPLFGAKMMKGQHYRREHFQKFVLKLPSWHTFPLPPPPWGYK